MAGNTKFEKLLEPGYIGKVKTRNRMIKSAAYGWILYDAINDALRPEGLAYYEAIARGGIGLQIMEISAIHPKTIGRPLYDDKYITVERQITDRMHKHGCPTFAHFYDFRPLMPQPAAAAASAVCYPAKLDMNNALPIALTTGEIQNEVDMLANAALRARKADYDGVELNAGCSHLFATFLSRFWNKRTDQYGPQNLENRARILVEMIQEIKKRCGADYPVSVLMNGFELNVLELGNNSDCSTFEETTVFARLFEEAGADLLHVRSQSIGNHINGFFPEKYYMFGQPDTGYGHPLDLKKFFPEFITRYNGAAGFIDTAAIIKKAVAIPVMTVGCMDPRLHPEIAENALRRGSIDFVAMTRPLTADPELPNKLAAGKLDDIRPCTYCITCFPQTRCRVNAASTRADGAEMPEGYDVQPAAIRKKVLVVGGGPAGMEAARVAALRGHQVTLFEKNSRLGGLMPLAAMVKGPHEKILDFVNYLSKQIHKLGIEFKLGREADLQEIDRLKPDVVIVATGGISATPGIPGIDNPKVIGSSALHRTLESGLRFISPFTLRALTNLYMPVGQKVVIIGGQIQGVQLAEFLAQRGRDVTLVDEGPEENLGLNLPGFVKPRVILYVQAHGVKTLMNVKYQSITDKGLTIITGYGIKKTLKADSILIALPSSVNTGLADSLKGRVAEVYAIGDCLKPGVIVDAIEAGNLTARKI
jgi:2,4-dienoyl-CoA reductase-like NADH-dependent reductase (Old Yellow Enzyme family)/thioredoxin reductase